MIAAGQAINALSARRAKAALAAFLRVRIAAANERQAIDLRGSGLSMTDLVEKTETFVTDNPEDDDLMLNATVAYRVVGDAIILEAKDV